MTSLGTLSVDLELNGDGTFTTKAVAVDGVLKTLASTAQSTAAGINTLSAAFTRTNATIGNAMRGSSSAQSATAALRAETDRLTQAMAASASSSQKTASAMVSAATDIQKVQQAFREATASATAYANAAASAGKIKTPSTASPSSSSRPAASGLTSAIPAVSGSGIAGLTAMVPELAAITAGVGLAEKAFAALRGQFTALISDGDAYTQSVNRIQAVLGSSRDVAAQTYIALEQGAVRTGVDVGELTRSFANFQISLSGIGQTRSQIVDFTTTLSTLAHVSGTSSAAANRAFRELAEGMATGAVNLRQLKIVAQDMPPLLKALADSLHVTTGQLEEMAGQGKLTTETVAQAVETMGGQVQKQFGQLPVSLQTARQNLATAMAQFRAELDQSLGFSQLLSKWDSMWARMIQTAADASDKTLPARLSRLKAELAELQAADRSGNIGAFANSEPAMQQRIASVQALIGQLENQMKAQQDADASSAASAKQNHEQSGAIDALTAAMKSLGAAPSETTPQIAALSDAIAHGHDVTLPYNDGLISASQVIDLLRQRATPAAAALADLNRQLVEASARAQGGFEASLTAARLKADPLDPSGQGRHLSSAQQDQLKAALDQIGAAQGQEAVMQAQRRLALARARQQDTTGLAAGRLQAGYDRDDFVREHGTGTGATTEAGQLFDAETSAAQIDAMQRGMKAAQSAGNAVTDLKARLAELQASMTDGGTETAKWTAKLADASPALKAQAAHIMALAAQIDAATAAQKRYQEAQEAIQRLHANVSKAQTDASDAAAELAEGPQPDFVKQLDRMKRQQAELVEAARDAGPDSGQQAQQLADQASDTEALALIRSHVNENRLATAQINKAWDDSETGRRAAALQTVQIEGSALQDAIGKYVIDANERKALSADTAAFMEAKTKEAMRQTEGATSQLGRQWADTTAMMDQATASFASSFVDNLASQLTTGKASWKDFADSVVAELDKIAIKAALSPILNAAGNSLSSGFGNIFGSLFGSSGAQDFEGAGIAAAGFHTGGLIGAGEQTFTRTISSDLFRNAPKYHTGGLAGDEIPAILQRGEGVFTKGQMAAIGAALDSKTDIGPAFEQAAHSMRASSAAVSASIDHDATATDPSRAPSAPKITMNVHNQSGQDMKTQTGSPKFDGESWVIDTVIKHATRPGNLRNVLGSGN